MSSGGGGGQPANTTSQVILPEFINEAAKANLASGMEVANRPYEANPYAAVAGLTPDQQAYYQAVRDFQGAGTSDYDTAIAQASGLLGQAAPITADQMTSTTRAL